MSAKRVVVVSGSRAEFGLLEPVMRAIAEEDGLELQVVVGGAHLVGEVETWRDVKEAGFEIAGIVEMQRAGERGRVADAVAVGRGVEGFARVFAKLEPRWVVVLGDRVEAFAAAAAASIAGFGVAHLHGGDRAEGIADEALRHAVTKLSHLHLAATEESARRIVRMGEEPERVRVVGSPALDGLERIEAMSEEEAGEFGDPMALFLMHPSGLEESSERRDARGALACAAREFGGGVACFAPNHDPGREVVLEEVRGAAGRHGWVIVEHLPRRRFVSLLKRVAGRGGVLIGNSSCGLIEAAALRLRVVNVGPRQGGRERPNNVVDAETGDAVGGAIQRALRVDHGAITHPYGDGQAGRKTAGALVAAAAGVRKRCVY